MHSSEALRGSQFEILSNGDRIEHSEFFSAISTTTRLGVLTPSRFEAAGAINLIMAHVTAFYDCYRTTNESFFTYPDYFTFQSLKPKASYSMFDIWPDHKSVVVPNGSGDRLDGITDRAVNILLVPEGQPSERNYERLQLAAAKRLIHTCYLYSADGAVRSPDLIIRCTKEPFTDWVRSMFTSVPEEAGKEATECWEKNCSTAELIEQSFRRINLKEALQLL